MVFLMFFIPYNAPAGRMIPRELRESRRTQSIVYISGEPTVAYRVTPDEFREMCARRTWGETPTYALFLGTERAPRAISHQELYTLLEGDKVSEEDMLVS